VDLPDPRPAELPDGHAQHAYVGMQWAFIGGLFVVAGLLSGMCMGLTLVMVPAGLVALPPALWRLTKPGPRVSGLSWRRLSRILIVTSAGLLAAGLGVVQLEWAHGGLEQALLVASALAAGALSVTLAMHVRSVVAVGHPLRIGWPLAVLLQGLPLAWIGLAQFAMPSPTREIAVVFAVISIFVISIWMLLRSGHARAALRSLRPEPVGPAHVQWAEVAQSLDLTPTYHPWGLELLGRGDDGLTTRVRFETSVAPARLRVEVPVPALRATDSGRALWVRRRTAADREAAFGDPVLDAALAGGGPRLTELLGGLHATLLEAVHGHPATLSQGQVVLELPLEQRDVYLEPKGMELAPRRDRLPAAIRAMRRLAGILQIQVTDRIE